MTQEEEAAAATKYKEKRKKIKVKYLMDYSKICLGIGALKFPSL